MAFPEKILFVNKGWKDLREIDTYSEVRDGKTITLVRCHEYCKRNLHIGLENNQLFRFCPRCLIKIKD